jgi:hypothetical protein
MVQSFLKKLMAGTDGKGDRLSPSLARRIKTNLGMLLADAQENGLVARNVARGSKRRRHGTHEERGGKLKVGVIASAPSSPYRRDGHEAAAVHCSTGCIEMAMRRRQFIAARAV